MDKILEDLDPKMRLSIALSLGLLAILSGALSLHRLVTGPWTLVFATAFIAVAAQTLSQKALPASLPKRVSDFISQWEKVKSRSTKKAGGRFVWKVGRTVIAAVLASAFLEMTSNLAGSLYLAVIAGFACSAGFFGVGPSLWAGLLVFLGGHSLALGGLNVDFTDPASRAAFGDLWTKGAGISWWWPIGLLAGTPIWIGLAAAFVKLGAKITEELATRAEASEAKRKIEARRNRLKGRQNANGGDPVAAAVQAREEAEAKILASASGKDGKIVSDIDPSTIAHSEDNSSKDTTELRGVAKLEHDNNAAILTRYIEHVRSISESVSKGIDVDTVGRRSLDRVIQAMDDNKIAMLISGVLPGSADLVRYYNQICGQEALVLSGGDGEIISTFPVSDVMDAQVPNLGPDAEYFSEQLQEPGHQKLDQAEQSFEAGEDDLPVDLLDFPPEPTIVGRRGASISNLEMMLAKPLELPQPEQAALNTSSPEIVNEESVSSKSEFASVELLHQPESFEDDALTHDEQNSVEADVTPEANEDAAENDKTRDPVGTNEPDEAVKRPSENPADFVGNEEGGVSQDKRNAAVRIMAGETGREFIVSSMDYFSSAKEAAAALMVDEAHFTKPFSVYRDLANGARLEAKLVDLMAGDDIEAVRQTLQDLDGIAWKADEEVISGAESKILAFEDRMQQAAEDAALAEVQKDEQDAEKASVLDTNYKEEEKPTADLNDFRRKSAVDVLIGNVSDDLLAAGSDLFPTVEALADALGQEPHLVQSHFDVFRARYLAKQKLDLLRQAWNDQDLEHVEMLISDPSSFEAIDGFEAILEGARNWAEGELAKNKVLGLKEGFEGNQNIAGEATRKKFMRRMHNTTDAQAEIIEQTLPKALTIISSLKTLISTMGEAANPVMLAELDKAYAQAGYAAAQLVNDEVGCRKYAVAFFPDLHRPENGDVWGLISDLAQTYGVERQGDATEDEKPVNGENDDFPSACAEYEESSSERVEEEFIKPGTQPNLNNSPPSLSVEEIQRLDPVEQVKSIVRGKLLSIEEYERKYNLACVPLIGPGYEVNKMLKSEANGYSMHLGEKDGKDLGKLLFWTVRNPMPVWYHEDTNKVFFITEGNISSVKAQDASGIERQMDVLFAEKDESRENVSGLIVMSPFITENGIRSFEPFLKKFQNRHIIFLNHNLPSDVISAFVEKIKGA